jgi:integrase
VRLALATGMRRSELLSLTWVQVDFDRGIIALLRTKNGFPRQVPLTEEALDVLRDLELLRAVAKSASGAAPRWGRSNH